MLLTLPKRKDTRGRSTGRSRAAARAHSFAQVDHILGHILLPGRDRGAVLLPRVTPESAAHSLARLSGSLFVFRNARPQFRWQAIADVARVRIHNSDPLRKLVGFDACEPSERIKRSVPKETGDLRNVSGS